MGRKCVQKLASADLSLTILRIKTWAKMLKRHIVPSVSFARHRATNSVADGQHSKIPMVRLPACGLRNLENYKADLIYCGKRQLDKKKTKEQLLLPADNVFLSISTDWHLPPVPEMIFGKLVGGCANSAFMLRKRAN